MISEFAPAKINLCLHVTGQRGDGYHLLDSLVMFADMGDRVTVCDADKTTLEIAGPFGAGLLAEPDNLVLQAARLIAPERPVAIGLEKNLPVASGIGGGSSDAAATLRALSRHFQMPLPGSEAVLGLGADVPVCMTPSLYKMSGIGEELDDLGPAPMLDLLLVNPGVSVPTAAIFGRLGQKDNPPLPATMPDPFDTEDWIDWLKGQRNDLQAPAIATEPVIGTVLDMLGKQAGCRMARMSGSGATCFAIFDDHGQRDNAAQAIRRSHPDWWVAQADEWNA